ncbi:YrrS family protein [Terribacillus sp. DMT04]|uniref:YrrS family protein n=1 Tax=Terribacillus sp. DMT04 TaxID=2850441 RepID=UPI001C2C5149|nr:YrrS family protein [Terribacillus sp. DMT04]QXE00505.1 YrrS family protein [Terribacillus sp. DMT04]
MADENKDYSRLNNRNQRRKPKKWLSLVLALAGAAVVVVLLIAVLNDKPTASNETADDDQNKQTIADQVSGNNASDDENKEQSDEEKKEEQDKEEKDSKKEEVEPSDDNVKEAYKKDWEPIGTEQSGAHTTTFQEETKDWQEIEQAAAGAVGLDPASMTTWYIGNDGNGGNDVVATISGSNSAETFRVYASWVDGEGWQATKVEVLKENDKKNI